MNKFAILAFTQILYSVCITNAQSPDWLWAEGGGGIYMDRPSALTKDLNENIFITGIYNSPAITFDTITLNNSGAEEVFLAKYDDQGNIQWAKTASGNSQHVSYGVAADSSGNVYITGGYHNWQITFDTVVLANSGGFDCFLVKYDANGNVLWGRSAGGSSNEIGYGIACDGNGDIYIAGYFELGTLIIGDDTLTNTGNSLSRDMFLAKYDSTGKALWAKKFGDYYHEHATALTIDPAGNVLMTGYFWSQTVQFDAITLTNASSSFTLADICVVKLDPNGNTIWAKSAGGVNGDEGWAISSDPSGNVYVAGNFYSPQLNCGAITLTGAGSSNDAVMIKYNSSGTELWAKSAGGVLKDEAHGVCTDTSGNVYLTGQFFNPFIVFNGDTLWNSGGGIFIVKYTSSGSLLWSKEAGSTPVTGSGSNNVYGIITGTQGHAYIAASSASSSVAFGIDTIFNEGSWDIILAKLDKEQSTGINDIEATTASLLIYPNPFADQIKIETGNDLLSELTLYDIMARPLLHTTFTNETAIVAEHLQSGIYLLMLTDNKGMVRKHKVIKR